MNITIRSEVQADYPAIHHVVQSAFEHAEHSNHDEHHLVTRLRKSATYIPELALVAEVDRRIAGHILFTIVTVGKTQALALAPVSVIPALQGRGIGGQLIRAGHQIAKTLGYGYSILVGHAEYYPRFGYLPAREFGIRAPFEVPEENFMACNLQGQHDRLDGMVIYAPEFFETGQ